MQQQRDGQKLCGKEPRPVLLVEADLRRPEGPAHRDEQLPGCMEGEPLQQLVQPLLQPCFQQPRKQQLELDARPDLQPDQWRNLQPDFQPDQRWNLQPDCQPDQRWNLQPDCQPAERVGERKLQPVDHPDFEPDDQRRELQPQVELACEGAQHPLQLEQQRGVVHFRSELGPPHQSAPSSPRCLSHPAKRHS